MDLHHLKTFITVSAESSVTKAAHRLHMTPSTISGHIKTLEEELGITLFERTARGMKLTEHGRLLHAKAAETLHAAQALLNQAHQLQTELTGELTIGLNASSTLLRMGQISAELQRIAPNLTVHMVSSATGKIIDAVAKQ